MRPAFPWAVACLALAACTGGEDMAEPAELLVPPTCSYDEATGRITVAMDGTPGTLSVTDGVIVLDTTSCGTLTNTDTIAVSGTGALLVRGDFVPGRTPEPTGQSEIEFSIDTDQITFDAAEGNDVVTIVPTGADLNSDGDQDVMMSGTQTRVVYQGGAGGDTLDASACTDSIILRGGPSGDLLIGGAGADLLYGGGDADTLEGNGGNDVLFGGPGPDVEHGGPGDDTFREDGSANGFDWLDGGSGFDTLSYASRTASVSVTLNDNLANDGEPGEGDDARQVESAIGGAGDDLLVGTADRNLLAGGGGNDSLHSHGGPDDLYGDDGNDLLDGGVGLNNLVGGRGDDTLIGDDGGNRDTFAAGPGNDTILGNADGTAEYVRCGDGFDTAEAASEDTFVSCENLTSP